MDRSAVRLASSLGDRGRPPEDVELAKLVEARCRQGWLYAGEPRPFIWADDDLGTMAEAYEWCKEVDGLPIVPQTEVGLTRANVTEMREYVSRKSR